ncbi:MAG: tyrosine-type recombinase/integrase [Acidimicrobiales bacterium]
MATTLTRPAPSALDRLVDDYLIHCEARGLSPRTLTNNYGYALRDVFLPWCREQGIAEVRDLDGRTVDRFTSALLHRERNGRPISKHTVHSYIRPVRQLLTWAAREGEEVRAKPQLPMCPRPLRDVLSRDEIDLLEKAVDGERDKLIIRIFGDCGLRLDELTTLTPDDVQRSGRQAYLRVMGKWSRRRDVPLPPPLLRRLERLIQSRPVDRSADRIFLSHRRGPTGEFDPLTRSGVYQVVQDAVARAPIGKRVHPHLLRHSWMTEMLRAGMSPIQLSLIAGASVQVIFQHYTHLTKDDAYAAMLRALTDQRVSRQRD